jgi:hypothetical protein
VGTRDNGDACHLNDVGHLNDGCHLKKVTNSISQPQTGLYAGGDPDQVKVSQNDLQIIGKEIYNPSELHHGLNPDSSQPVYSVNGGLTVRSTPASIRIVIR